MIIRGLTAEEATSPSIEKLTENRLEKTNADGETNIKRKEPMKKTMIAVMASLVATVAVNAQAPIGTVHHAERGPEDILTLQNGAPTQVVALHGIGRGTWTVWGACTVQDTVMAGVPGYYIYTYTGISPTPNTIPGGGLQYLDARPYHSGYMGDNGNWHPNLFWWFGANPPPRVFHFNADPSLYVNALSWAGTGGTPPLARVFCSIIAEKTGE